MLRWRLLMSTNPGSIDISYQNEIIQLPIFYFIIHKTIAKTDRLFSSYIKYQHHSF